MKSSKKVVLVALGAAFALSGCGNSDGWDAGKKTSDNGWDGTVKQDTYASLEDCKKDWGPDSDLCSPINPPTQVASNTTTSSTSGGHGGVTYINTGGGGYYGPRYYWDRSQARPMALMPSGETRALSASHFSSRGPSVAKSSSVSSVSRGGFGGGARGGSSGG